LDHSKNVTRGQLDCANNGSWIGSPPYAYRLEGPKYHKRLVRGEDAHVRVVQRIFREFVEDGRSMKNIADRLNADGYPSPGRHVKGWRFDAVKVILENPAYTGDYCGSRWSYGKYHRIKEGQVGKSTGRARNPEAQWIIHRDHHEPIIDRETFARAQTILARGKTGRSPYTPEDNPYLLSGLLRCGRPGCGCTLSGLSNGTYRYYECGRRKYDGADACAGTTVREDRVLYSVARHLMSEFFSLDGAGPDGTGPDGDSLSWRAKRQELEPGDLPKAFAKVKELVAPPRQPAVDRKRTEKQAKALGEQIDRARRNLVLLDPENIPVAQEEVRRLTTELEELRTELRKRPPSEEDLNAEALEVMRALYWLAILFGSAADEARLGTEDREGAFLVGAGRSGAMRHFLGRIAGITAHTRIESRGTRTRHVFQGGEIALNPVGRVPGDLDPHLPGKSRKCCR
jgi:hypothetical protein